MPRFPPAIWNRFIYNKVAIVFFVSVWNCCAAVRASIVSIECAAAVQTLLFVWCSICLRIV
jgi:hypothetical protein